MELIKNTERRKYQRGPTPWPRGWGRALPPGRTPASWPPWWPSDAHLWLYGVFHLGKNHKQAHGTKLLCHEAEPILGSDGAILPWKHPSEMGKSSPSILSSGGVNLHQHLHQRHLLSNLSSSLVSDLCLKTSDWYLWVASSVDYSL